MRLLNLNIMQSFQNKIHYTKFYFERFLLPFYYGPGQAKLFIEGYHYLQAFLFVVDIY